MEFKSFGEIKKLTKLQFNITQKIHGSNAQVFVYPKEDGTLDLVCGSRTRWIYPHTDNYGFATFVDQYKQEFIEKLGQGVHFGEWAGPGINSGEGLAEKTFVLFDFWRYPPERPLPPQTKVVPVLYHGEIDLKQIDLALEDLKTNGSKLVPGFMRPEGVVVSVNGVRYKKVFNTEEVAWTKGSGVKNANPKTFVDFNYLCQPIRLEKLLSRDEQYLKGYPKTLPDIVKAYVADLVKENQISGTDDEIKAIQKAASGQIFKFVKTVMEEKSVYG